MNYESITAYVTIGSLLLLLVGVAAYDIFIISKKGKYYSVSAWMIRQARKFPIIPSMIMFIIGLLVGHLFWAMSSKDIYKPDSQEMREICKDVIK